MVTSKFRTMREEHLKDPTFRAEVAREKALMAEIGLAAGKATGITRRRTRPALRRSVELLLAPIS